MGRNRAIKARIEPKGRNRAIKARIEPKGRNRAIKARIAQSAIGRQRTQMPTVAGVISLDFGSFVAFWGRSRCGLFG